MELSMQMAMEMVLNLNLHLLPVRSTKGFSQIDRSAVRVVWCGRREKREKEKVIKLVSS